MSRFRRSLTAAGVAAAGALAALTLAPASAAAQQAASVDIPYTKFTLSNGLTVLVHEDHKAPIVAVNVWYHVGSKNEKPGRTGFAHLFEHLMFNGSENFNDDYFKTLEAIGATDLNGTTNEDRTNYFQNVPTSALDVVLWMESDRMGHLLGAIDQAKLDEQRGVVQNEKRQGENNPYGLVWDFVTPKLFPAAHPYSWTVIGSLADLDAAKLDDVKDWFRTYYGPSNAVVVLAGDITPDVAKQKMEKFFGDIPPGPPIAKPAVSIAPRRGSERGIMQDRVPQARVYKFWNVPEHGAADADYLDLVSDVLASGKTSRLYKRLVYDEQIATDVAAYIDDREIASVFVIQATARPGGDLAAVEKAVSEELARLLAEGPTAEELTRVKVRTRAAFIRGVERIGGFGGKSDVLAQGEIYLGNPAAYKERLARVAAATAADLQGAARRWLSDGDYTLEVHPFPQLAAGNGGADRTSVPTPGAEPAPRFPTFERATLSNGLKVLLARRTSVPQVNLSLVVDAGYAADQGVLPGTANLAMAMLDEGTKTRSALDISEQLALLGANMGTGSNLDQSFVSLSALSDKLDASLEIWADVILNPSFPKDDFERLQRQTLARIQREKVVPIQLALRVMPQLLYGTGHAYSNPLTGSGTEASVGQLAPDKLAEFHRAWFKPNNATVVVVGNTTMAELRPKLERLFKDWKTGRTPSKNIGTVAQRDKPTVYLMDRPGAQQTVILAADLAPPRANPDEAAIEVMTGILGGNFTSRVNMNLREDKHWSYGAFTFVWAARGQRPFLVYAPVQTDKTKESMLELKMELEGILGPKPIVASEISLAKNALTLTLPGRWETMNAVQGDLTDIVTYGLPEDYWSSYAQRIAAVKPADLLKAARTVVQPGHLTWVIVGDRAKIEAGVRELGWGELIMLDADGKPMGAAQAAK